MSCTTTTATTASLCDDNLIVVDVSTDALCKAIREGDSDRIMGIINQLNARQGTEAVRNALTTVSIYDVAMAIAALPESEDLFSESEDLSLIPSADIGSLKEEAMMLSALPLARVTPAVMLSMVLSCSLEATTTELVSAQEQMIEWTKMTCVSPLAVPEEKPKSTIIDVQSVMRMYVHTLEMATEIWGTHSSSEVDDNEDVFSLEEKLATLACVVRAAELLDRVAIAPSAASLLQAHLPLQPHEVAALQGRPVAYIFATLAHFAAHRKYGPRYAETLAALLTHVVHHGLDIAEAAIIATLVIVRHDYMPNCFDPSKITRRDASVWAQSVDTPNSDVDFRFVDPAPCDMQQAKFTSFECEPVEKRANIKIMRHSTAVAGPVLINDFNQRLANAQAKTAQIKAMVENHDLFTIVCGQNGPDWRRIFPKVIAVSTPEPTMDGEVAQVDAPSEAEPAADASEARAPTDVAADNDTSDESDSADDHQEEPCPVTIPKSPAPKAVPQIIVTSDQLAPVHNRRRASNILSLSHRKRSDTADKNDTTRKSPVSSPTLVKAKKPRNKVVTEEEDLDESDTDVKAQRKKSKNTKTNLVVKKDSKRRPSKKIVQREEESDEDSTYSGSRKEKRRDSRRSKTPDESSSSTEASDYKPRKTSSSKKAANSKKKKSAESKKKRSSSRSSEEKLKEEKALSGKNMSSSSSHSSDDDDDDDRDLVFSGEKKRRVSRESNDKDVYYVRLTNKGVRSLYKACQMMNIEMTPDMVLKNPKIELPALTGPSKDSRTNATSETTAAKTKKPGAGTKRPHSSSSSSTETRTKKMNPAEVSAEGMQVDNNKPVTPRKKVSAPRKRKPAAGRPFLLPLGEGKEELTLEEFCKQFTHTVLSEEERQVLKSSPLNRSPMSKVNVPIYFVGERIFKGPFKFADPNDPTKPGNKLAFLTQLARMNIMIAYGDPFAPEEIQLAYDDVEDAAYIIGRNPTLVPEEKWQTDAKDSAVLGEIETLRYDSANLIVIANAFDIDLDKKKVGRRGTSFAESAATKAYRHMCLRYLYAIGGNTGHDIFFETSTWTPFCIDFDACRDELHLYEIEDEESAFNASALDIYSLMFVNGFGLKIDHQGIFYKTLASKESREAIRALIEDTGNETINFDEIDKFNRKIGIDLGFSIDIMARRLYTLEITYEGFLSAFDAEEELPSIARKDSHKRKRRASTKKTTPASALSSKPSSSADDDSDSSEEEEVPAPVVKPGATRKLRPAPPRRFDADGNEVDRDYIFKYLGEEESRKAGGRRKKSPKRHEDENSSSSDPKKSKSLRQKRRRTSSSTDRSVDAMQS